ncbi:MAG: hypothetical protein WKG32_04260 [Gemmatimonadaceae bacterium]
MTKGKPTGEPDDAHPPPMPADERAAYDPGEQRTIRDALSAGRSPTCPRCDVLLTGRPIGGGSFGLGYARRREWLICPRCRRSAIFDVKRGTRN